MKKKTGDNIIKRAGLLLAAVLSVAVVFCSCSDRRGTGEPGAIVSSTPSAYPTATSTPTPTNTPTPTSTPTPTVSPTPTLPAEDPNAPAYSGTAYAVTNDKGEIVLALNARDRILPASTIKMLTALTAVEHAEYDKLLTSTEEQVTIDKATYGYGCVPGMTYPLEVWLHLMMISSYGDAANVISGNIGGTIEHFVELMNVKAQELELTHTHVDNPIGLDILDDFFDIYTTAEDMSKLAYAYYQNKKLLEIAGKAEYQVPDCDAMPGKLIKNTNFYLSFPEKYKSDCFDVIGTKSGSTKNAGNCFIITAVGKGEYAGKTYIISVFGNKDKAKMFDEMTAILEYCFKNNK